MNLNRILLAFLIFNLSLFIPEKGWSQQIGKYFKVEVQKDVSLESWFLLYLPEDYDSLDQKWPLLMFLHGKGERGNMLELLKKQGPPKLIEYGKSFPFIVISPQCPENELWSVDVLDMLLDEMNRRYRVDTNCLFVTGLSMGGTATWELAYAYPKRFAAIAPVCARTDVSQAAKIKSLPVWVFHGAKDDVVPPEESINMVNALKALGSPVRFTLYPEANHNAWTETYDNPELWEWLLQQCR